MSKRAPVLQSAPDLPMAYSSARWKQRFRIPNPDRLNKLITIRPYHPLQAVNPRDQNQQHQYRSWPATVYQKAPQTEKAAGKKSRPAGNTRRQGLVLQLLHHGLPRQASAGRQGTRHGDRLRLGPARNLLREEFQQQGDGSRRRSLRVPLP